MCHPLISLSRALRAWLFFAVSTGLVAAASPRERLSLDADWRFAKGDPAVNEGQLTYAKIKAWVLPDRGTFSRAGARERHTRGRSRRTDRLRPVGF